MILIKKNLLEISFILISVALNFAIFYFDRYFAFRELFLFPSVENFKPSEKLLENANYLFLQVGLPSHIFYAGVFQILFNFGVILNFFVFRAIIEYIKSYKKSSEKNAADTTEPQTKPDLKAGIIAEKIVIFSFVLLTVYNPITLKFFLLGSLSDFFAIFTLPFVFYLTLIWFTDLNRVITHIQKGGTPPVQTPALNRTAIETFIISFTLFVFTLLNLSVTFISLVGLLVFVGVFFSLSFDLRKELFYKPTIYEDERGKYKTLFGILLIKYLLYPIIIIIPSLLVIFLVNNNAYTSNFGLESSVFSDYAFSGISNLYWLNINISSFPEMRGIAERLGFLQYTTTLFNPVISNSFLVISLTAIVFWLFRLFKTKSRLSYQNLILLTTATIYSIVYGATLFLNPRQLNGFNLDHTFMFLFISIILIFLFVFVDLGQLFAKQSFFYLSGLGFVCLLLLAVNMLPFTMLNKAINYFDINEVYKNVDDLCAQGTKVAYVPSNLFIRGVYSQPGTQIREDYGQIPLVNPITRLKNCQPIDLDQTNLEPSFYEIANVRAEQERSRTLVQNLKEQSIGVVVVDSFNTPSFKQFKSNFNQVLPPVIVDNEINVYVIP